MIDPCIAPNYKVSQPAATLTITTPEDEVVVHADESTRELAVEGRRLLVEFTCGRCGHTQLIPYIENPACGAYANLRKHDIPDGWQHAGHYTPLLCPACKRAFERFMSGLN